MKFMQLFIIMTTLLILAACENDIKRVPLDGIGSNDELVVGDTDNNGTDNPIITDGDTPVLTDGDTPVLTDSDTPVGNDTEPNDDSAIDDTIPDDAIDTEPVDDEVVIPDVDNTVGFLHIEVTGPTPVDEALKAIAAVEPTPTDGGTGTPAITSNIGPTALVAIGLIEDNALGCNAYKTVVTGSIVLVQRGTCQFSQKITNAANAGASAIIVYNNTQGVLEMQADGTIPAVGITQADGEAIIAFTQAHPDITAAIRAQ